MGACKYFRFFFALFLINFIIFLSLFFCIFYKNESKLDLYILILVLLICFLSVNFLLFSFWAKIIDYSKKNQEIKCIFNKEINKCLINLSEKNKLANAAKISLGIYHDLSNILTASNLTINNAILEPFNNKKINIFLERIVKINNSANCLINSFKNQFYQSKSLQYFYPEKEIRSCLNIFNFYFIKHKIKVKTNLNKKILIFGDPVKFSQIIINLLNNSIDSFDSSQVNRNIFIRIHIHKDFGNVNCYNLELLFKDSGRGIEEEFLNNVFDPFFSLKNNDNLKHCGVGLSLVKRIVEDDFSGKIFLSSSLGLGTKFRIIFPKIKK